MKSSKHIRIGMMSVIALVAFGFASNAMAAVDAYLWFKASDGKVTKVKINHDGTFQTPPLAPGTYSVSWGLTQAGGQAVHDQYKGGVDRSVSSGGDRPQESIHLTFQKIEWTYQVQSPRDAGSGMSTGRRMHKPITITKEVDMASPKLMTALGTVVIEANGETISGTVSGVYKNGGKSAADAWDGK
ncbi:MAG: type VI secretion system tube protein Hcp [Candidatus Kapaibacterium sp.]